MLATIRSMGAFHINRYFIVYNITINPDISPEDHSSGV
jgi:hypothetical protein